MNPNSHLAAISSSRVIRQKCSPVKCVLLSSDFDCARCKNVCQLMCKESTWFPYLLSHQLSLSFPYTLSPLSKKYCSCLDSFSSQISLAFLSSTQLSLLS